MIVFVDTKSRIKKKSTGKTNPTYTKYSPSPFKTKSLYSLGYRRDDHRDIPSVTARQGDTSKQEPLKYSGDRLIGIGVMHKSNLVPIFSQEEATDSAHMRR